MAAKWLNNILGKDEKPEVKTDDTGNTVAPAIQAKLEERKDSLEIRKANIKKHPVANDVLLFPVYTEKALLASGMRKYVFEISTTATKLAVKKAFFNLFGMMPESVNIVKTPGKVVRYGRVMGKRNDVKKAIITLKKGESIQ